MISCYGDNYMQNAVQYATVAISMMKSHGDQVIGYGCIILKGHEFVNIELRIN